MPLQNSIFIGWDPREAAAFAVARSSCRFHLNLPVPIYGLVLDDLKARGLYTRPIEYRKCAVDRPIMWDVISDAPMSTEHACSRFLVPHLAKSGWALFMDGDVLIRGNLDRMFASLDPKYAVYCVKHRYEPAPGTKMDHQIQTNYARKNWSSFLCFQTEHPSNRKLTLEMINTLPGRDLHRLCWLEDDEIGELGPQFNFLVGVTHAPVDPVVCHFTEGCPDMAGYNDVDFADEWRIKLNDWARGASSYGA